MLQYYLGDFMHVMILNIILLMHFVGN